MFTLLAALGRSSGHSWISCTDYSVADPKAAPKGLSETDPARLAYDPTKCHGYPRDWSKYASPFGTDRGANTQTNGITMCAIPRNDLSNYSPVYPIADYRTGSVVCATHPSKNHVAATCTNSFIPDAEYKLYRSAVNPTSDPSMNNFVEVHHYNGVHVDGTIDYKGYQNCPNFCNDMDKSLCTVCFDIESNLLPGRYTYMWKWTFNPGTDPYTTCWEANVVSSGTVPVPAPTVPAPKPVVTPTPPAPTAPKPTVPAALSCYCNCPCNTQCWKKCTCTTPGASRTCPICSGSAPAPIPPVAAPVVPAPVPVPSSCISTWGQCSGLGYAGATSCCSASDICVGLNTYYGQCRPR